MSPRSVDVPSPRHLHCYLCSHSLSCLVSRPVHDSRALVHHRARVYRVSGLIAVMMRMSSLTSAFRSLIDWQGWMVDRMQYSVEAARALMDP